MQDHFESLLALEAILPNGHKFHSILKDIAGDEIHNNFKWGIGPYFDGLFTQSNFGIVTEATIAIVKRPERIEIFVIEFNSNKQLPEAVQFIREVRKNHMSQMTQFLSQGFDLNTQIKKILDPNQILSPGRYGPLT